MSGLNINACFYQRAHVPFKEKQEQNRSSLWPASYETQKLVIILLNGLLCDRHLGVGSYQGFCWGKASGKTVMEFKKPA